MFNFASVNTPKLPTTEEKILEAAEAVFHEKGYDGARMQEIADQAQINKGLLHYYFKSKDLLFDAIFSMALRRMVSNVGNILALEVPLEEKLDLVVDTYMNMLLRNSSLPRFVIHELNKAPDKFLARHINSNVKDLFAHFEASVNREVQAGRIYPINAKHLFMNLISMLVFPFLGKPMIQVVMGIETKDFHAMMHERKDVVKLFIRKALRP